MHPSSLDSHSWNDESVPDLTTLLQLSSYVGISWEQCSYGSSHTFLFESCLLLLKGKWAGFMLTLVALNWLATFPRNPYTSLIVSTEVLFFYFVLASLIISCPFALCCSAFCTEASKNRTWSVCPKSSISQAFLQNILLGMICSQYTIRPGSLQLNRTLDCAG